MKSLKDYSLNIPDTQYHDYPAWSHSLIARYAREGFSAVSTIHEHTAPSPSMEFGSLFDSILTKGTKTLDEYVIDTTNTSVPPAEASVFDKLLSMNCTAEFDDLHETVLQTAIDACPTFQSKYKKPETRLEKLEAFKDYYNIRRTGKKIVSKQDWDDAVEMVRVFRQDEYLKKLFSTKNTKDKEYLYQTQYLVDITLDDGRTVKFKFMPDLLVVNHKDKTIQPVDLKTSSEPAYNFTDNFLRFRYDIQASSYTEGLQTLINGIPEYSDYNILPYLFTDISRTDKVPVTYIYDPREDSQIDGLSYGEAYTVKYKGWKQLLAELLDYEESNARVPSNITTKGPNDILSLLATRRKY